MSEGATIFTRFGPRAGKPHLRRFWHKGYIPKWECISPASSSWGHALARRGTGYTLRNAYVKWSRDCAGSV